MVMMPWVKPQPTNGSNVLKVGELQHITISSLTDFQLDGPNIWLSRRKTLPLEIANWLKSCRKGRNVYCFMPYNFNGRLRNPLGLINIFATTLTNDQTLQWFSICKNLLQMSLRVMRCGFTTMALKPNNPHPGQALLCLTPRKHNRYAYEWKKCCLFFFIIEALFSINSLLKVTQSRTLSGGSETSVGCCTKKVTWHVDYKKLAPPSW
jgi:hypothetical protein